MTQREAIDICEFIQQAKRELVEKRVVSDERELHLAINAIVMFILERIEG